MNDGFEYCERLPSGSEGSTLIAYLRRRYDHSSAVEWASRIEAGLVLLDGAPARPETTLRPGQTLVWRRPPWDEPPAPASIRVLLEDEDLLAVDKPAGLPTLPGAGYLQSTLLHLVRCRAPEASPLHRLGRWTSGVVLFARAASARSNLSRQWAERTVGKSYRALAAGDPAEDTIEVTARIGPVPHAGLGSVHGATPSGRPASSLVRVLERRAGCFLAEVEIATGRPHQIRIHLAATGHPLVGDPLYAAGGIPAPGTLALPGDPGYFLHAASLTFRHPRSGGTTRVECPPPPLLETNVERSRSVPPR